MRNRPERRTDYRHFPPEYIRAIELFERHGTVKMGPMTKQDALAVRLEMYRFRGMLRNAPRDDYHAQELSTIAEQMTARLVYGSFDTPTPESWFLEWSMNPIVRLVRGGQVTASEAHDILIPEENNPEND